MMRLLYRKKHLVEPAIALLLLLSIAVLPAKPVAAEDASQLFDFVSPSVVSIMAGNQVIGSGFIVNSEGYIITCAHVTKGGTKLKVKLDDQRVIPVEVLDQDTKLDLAVLRADEKSLPTVNFSLAAVKTGNKVYAVGSPLGMESSMSQGIVSNPSRIIQGQEFIQTNIAINSGNSGGPLFNASAQVIGVNSMKIGEAEGIAFAIPSGTVVEYLLSNDVPVATVTSTTGEASDLPGKTEDGQQSPADQPETAGKTVPLWMVIGVIIILVLAAGAGGYLYFKRRRRQAVSSGTSEPEPNIVLSSQEQQQAPPEDNLEDIDIELK